MKVILCLMAVVLVTTASPNGFYHQEYNYKTSASSYRNNELQHKTDDQGYYSKDGDLEGRVKPKVSANSEHSEYINPRLREQAGYYDAAAGADITSQGNLMANSYGGSLGASSSGRYHVLGSQYGNDQYSDGLASSDHIAGAYGSYGSGSSSSYSSSTLHSIASRLQNDIEREIQDALRSQSAYSHSIDINELETELRRNLTQKLQEALINQYGQQTIRAGQSYTLAGGRLQASPNYQQQELVELQKQLENKLLQQLRQEYSHSSSQSSHQSYSQNYHYESTTYRPIYPNLNTITTQRPFPAYPVPKDQYHSQGEYVNRVSNVRYTPVPNPLSITTIASNVQSQLDNQLNRLLEEAQRQYFSEDSRYTAYNIDAVLDQLRQQLKNNITYHLDEELRSQYGTQLQRDGYMYSVGNGGQISGQYNYNAEDLENLRKQVEDNLLTKLNRDFESYRQRWNIRQSQSQSYGHSQSHQSQSGYNIGSSSSNRYQYSTPNYNDVAYYTARPSSAIKGRPYNYLAGSSQSGYEVSSSSNVAELQKQLQSDLSRQLQAALTRHQHSMNQYSSSSGYSSPVAYDDLYRRLNDELQRNLTHQLQAFASGSAYSSSGGHVSEDQLASMKNYLQRNLASQLQQGLAQSYSASASYSARHSSSASSGGEAYSSGGSYRPTRGFENYQAGYGQYRSGGSYSTMGGEDCQGDDPNAYHTHRAKRSYGYRSRPLGLSTQTGSGYSSSGYDTGYHVNYNGGYYNPSGYRGSSSYSQHQPVYPIGQEEDDSDLTQQVESSDGFSSLSQGAQMRGQEEIEEGQQIDDYEDTQQLETDHGFSAIEIGSQNQVQVGGQQQIEINPQEDDIQQVETNGFGELKLGQTSNKLSNQHGIFSGYGKLEVGSHLREKKNDSTFGQQVQGNKFRQFPLPVSGNTREPHQISSGSVNVGTETQNILNQEVDDTDLTQQLEDTNYVKSSQQEPNRYPFNNTSAYDTLGVGFLVQSTTNKTILHAANSFDQQPNTNFRGPQSGQTLGQEVDDTDSLQTQEVSETSDFDIPGFVSQVDLTTKKPTLSGSTIFGDQTNTNYRNLHSASQQYQPVGQEIDDSEILQKQEISGKTDALVSEKSNLTPVSADNAFDNSRVGNNLHSNNNEQLDVATNSRENSFTSNAFLGFNKPSSPPISTLQLSSEITQISNQIESNLTKQLETSISNDVSYNAAPNQVYQDILLKLQKNITQECEKLLTDSSLNSYIDQTIVSKLEKYLTTNLEQKLQQKLLSFGFSRENIGIDSSSHTQQDIHNSQNTQFSSHNNYGGPNRYNQYSPRFVQRPAHTHAFIQREINSQQELGANFQQFNVNQQFDSLPTLNQVTNENKHLNEDSRQINNQFGSTTNHRYTSARPWSHNVYYYPGQTEIGEPGSIPPSYITLKPTHQETWQIGEPLGDVPSIQQKKTGTYKTNENPRQENNFSRNTLEPIGQHSERDTTLIEKRTTDSNAETFIPTGTKSTELSLDTSNSKSNPLHLSNFPPLPPPESNRLPLLPRPSQSGVPPGSTLPSELLPRPPSLFQTSTNLQPNQNDGEQRIEQNNRESVRVESSTTENFANAEREADYLIQQLRQAHINRQTATTNQNQEEERIYHRRPIYQEPSQYEVSIVKLENINQIQLNIIKTLEEDFTRQIKNAIQNQIKATQEHETSYKTYQHSLINLEQELHNNITEYINGATEPGLSKYSDLIAGTFDNSKIKDLEKYLQIKLSKKLKECLKEVYGIGSVSSNYHLGVHSSGEYHSGKISNLYSGGLSTGYHSSNNYKVHYGHNGYSSQNAEETSNIEPVQVQHATLVVPQIHAYSGGVKGGRYRLNQESQQLQTSYSQNSQLPPENPAHVVTVSHSEVSTEINVTEETSTTTTEQPSWWKRFGNKVKQGATSLKEKIVGK